MNYLFVKRFVKGIALSSISTVVQLVFGMISLMLAARMITKEQFGAFVLVQVISVFFLMCSGLALESVAVTKFIASAKDDEKMVLINSSIGIKLLVSLILSLVIVLCRPLINYFFNDAKLAELLIYIPPLFVLNTLEELLQKILQGLHLYKKMALAQILTALSRVGLVVLFLVVMKMDVHGLLLAFLISYVISIIYQYVVIPGKKRFVINWKPMKTVLKFSRPLGFNNILSFAFTYLDQFMIAAMLNPVQVAYYAIASKAPLSFRRLYDSFFNVFFPNMSELLSQKKYSEAEKVLSISIRYILFLSSFAAIGVALFREETILILFSEKYLASAGALSLLMLTLCINIVAHLLGTTLVALGRSDTTVKINSVTTLVNLVTNLILIPRFGFIGAVYATLLASIITNPVILFFYRKAPIHVRQRDYLKPLGLLVACYGLYRIVGIEAIWFRLSILLLFGGCSYYLSIITKKDIGAIRNTIVGMLPLKSAT